MCLRAEAVLQTISHVVIRLMSVYGEGWPASQVLLFTVCAWYLSCRHADRPSGSVWTTCTSGHQEGEGMLKGKHAQPLSP